MIYPYLARRESANASGVSHGLTANTKQYTTGKMV